MLSNIKLLSLCSEVNHLTTLKDKIMKAIISKLDKKTYYLAVATNCEYSAFIEGNRYQVRNATKEDCPDFEDYCVVNGTFWETLPEIDFLRISGRPMINQYNGTYFLHRLVLKSDCKKYLSYLN